MDGSRVLIRPSGTEPKLKVYTELLGTDFDATGVNEYIESLIVGIGDNISIME